MQKRELYLNAAKQIADWYCRNTAADIENNANCGSFAYYIEPDGKRNAAGEWIIAFSAMGLFSAARVFNEEKYYRTAEAMMRYNASLQIFDPFHSEHYGAIRELNAQSPWCFVRDALSAAWGYLEYCRISGKTEFLRRAELWGEWFLKHALDDTGWPIWGVVYDPDKAAEAPEMMLGMQGCFQGGCLNFFYHLYLETGERKWVGSFFEHIADYFCSAIQQPDGYFRTIDKATRHVPPDDPQNGLHRSNDDLGTIGLLCAYQVYRKPAYLEAIRRFVTAVAANQRADGLFETSCAGVPVVFNMLREAGDLISAPASLDEERALDGVLARQYPETAEPCRAGSLDELDEHSTCARSMAYTLIYLLKRFGGDNRFLTCKNKG